LQTWQYCGENDVDFAYSSENRKQQPDPFELKASAFDNYDSRDEHESKEDKGENDADVDVNDADVEAEEGENKNDGGKENDDINDRHVEINNLHHAEKNIGDEDQSKHQENDKVHDDRPIEDFPNKEQQSHPNSSDVLNGEESKGNEKDNQASNNEISDDPKTPESSDFIIPSQQYNEKLPTKSLADKSSRKGIDTINDGENENDEHDPANATGFQSSNSNAVLSQFPSMKILMVPSPNVNDLDFQLPDGQFQSEGDLVSVIAREVKFTNVVIELPSQLLGNYDLPQVFNQGIHMETNNAETVKIVLEYTKHGLEMTDSRCTWEMSKEQ